MPTLNIEGRKVKVGDEFLQMSSDEQNAAVEEIATSIGAAQEPETSTLSDVAQSAATGLREGVEGIAGMFGDSAQMTQDIAQRSAEYLGATPGLAKAIGKSLRYLNPVTANAPTTEDVRSFTEPVLGEAREPETTAGEFARTIGQFAPAAAAGPGGVVRKAAMTAVPAVASETAGQMTEGTAAEPYARLAGAAVGGLASAGRQATPAKMAAKGAPSREALSKQRDTLYETLRSAGIKYDANEFGNTVLRMAQDMRKAGMRRSVAGQAMDIVEELADDVKRGMSPDFDDINALRQNVGEMARTARRQGNGTMGKALDIVHDRLSEFERSAPFSNTAGLSGPQVNQLRGEARRTALQSIKARALDEVADKAETMAGGLEAGLRNGLRTLVRSKKGQQLFNKEERKALMDVANGRKGLQTLSRFGFDLTSISGNATFLPTIGAGGLVAAGEPIRAVLLAGAGTVAKQASPARTKRAFDQASGAIRSGRINDPKVRSEVARAEMDRLIRNLLAVESGGNSAAIVQPSP